MCYILEMEKSVRRDLPLLKRCIVADIGRHVLVCLLVSLRFVVYLLKGHLRQTIYILIVMSSIDYCLTDNRSVFFLYLFVLRFGTFV